MANLKTTQDYSSQTANTIVTEPKGLRTCHRERLCSQHSQAAIQPATFPLPRECRLVRISQLPRRLEKTDAWLPCHGLRCISYTLSDQFCTEMLWLLPWRTGPQVNAASQELTVPLPCHYSAFFPGKANATWDRDTEGRVGVWPQFREGIVPVNFLSLPGRAPARH